MRAKNIDIAYIWVHALQLRNISCHLDIKNKRAMMNRSRSPSKPSLFYLATVNVFTFQVKFFDFVGELFKLWNDKLTTESSRYQDNVFIDGPIRNVNVLFKTRRGNKNIIDRRIERLWCEQKGLTFWTARDWVSGSPGYRVLPFLDPAGSFRDFASAHWDGDPRLLIR